MADTQQAIAQWHALHNTACPNSHVSFEQAYVHLRYQTHSDINQSINLQFLSLGLIRGVDRYVTLQMHSCHMIGLPPVLLICDNSDVVYITNLCYTRQREW